MDHVKKVLADIKRVYPKYNAKKGYEACLDLPGFRGGMIWWRVEHIRTGISRVDMMPTLIAWLISSGMSERISTHRR
jgi:hypothetical protein